MVLMHGIVFLAKVLQIVCNLVIVESADCESVRCICLQSAFFRFPRRHHFYRYICPNIWGSPDIAAVDMLVGKEYLWTI